MVMYVSLFTCKLVLTLNLENGHDVMSVPSLKMLGKQEQSLSKPYGITLATFLNLPRQGHLLNLKMKVSKHSIFYIYYT